MSPPLDCRLKASGSLFRGLGDCSSVCFPLFLPSIPQAKPTMGPGGLQPDVEQVSVGNQPSGYHADHKPHSVLAAEAPLAQGSNQEKGGQAGHNLTRIGPAAEKRGRAH